jgi:hypothetical protein
MARLRASRYGEVSPKPAAKAEPPYCVFVVVFATTTHDPDDMALK